jgi:hypothetical protein
MKKWVVPAHRDPSFDPYTLILPPAICGGWIRQDKTRQDKTRLAAYHVWWMAKRRQDKTRQDKTRQDKTRQDKTRQDKTRQVKAQDKARHKRQDK